MRKVFVILLFAILALGVLPVSVWAHDPCIDIEKLVSVDGGQTFYDADTCNEGPFTDGPAEYKLVVTNCGNVDLTNFHLTDEALGIDMRDDSVVLPPGAVVIITKDGVVNQPNSIPVPELEVDDVCYPEKDVFENVAIITADGYYYGGFKEVSDYDEACVKCEPCLELEKQVSGDGGVTFFDADECSDDDVPFTLDDSVYRLIAKNCGEEAVVLDTIEDPDLGINLTLDPTVTIQPGDSVEFTNDAGQTKGLLQKEGVCPNPEGEFDNTATVSGTGASSFAFVEATDPACVKCGPCIKIQKNVRDAENLDGAYQTANKCEDGILVPINNGAEYRIRVSNCGGELLKDVVINDTVLGISGFFVGDLAVGEAKTFFFDRPDGGIPALLQPELCREISAETPFRNVADVRGVGGFSGIQVVHQNPACVECQPQCELQVEKFCSTPPPTPSTGKCEKPITELTLVWDGTETIDVEVENSTTAYGIEPNDEVVFDVSGAGNDVDFDIFRAGTTTLLGESRFHVSCSDPEMQTPDDCGTNQGNGRGNDSKLINDWILAGWVATNGVLDCNPESSSELAKECEVEGMKPGSCADGRPTALVFEYTGEDCVDGNDQDDGKWSCSGDPNLAAPVEVVMTKDAGVFTVTPSAENIGLNQTFEIRRTDELGKEFPSEIEFDIRQGGQTLQSLKMHTSCSQPLEVDDQFGSVILKQFVPKGSTSPNANVVYTYRVTNTGPAEVTVDVNDSELGLLADNIPIPAGETVELTEPVLLSEPGTVTNVVTVTDIDDPDCTATDEVTVEVVEPPEACVKDKTKVAEIIFEYTGEGCVDGNDQPADKWACDGTPGADPVSIIIKKDLNKITVDPSAVSVGDPLTISAIDREVGSEIQLEVGGQSLKFHTSCSKPLAEGDQFGSLLVKDLILIPK